MPVTIKQTESAAIYDDPNLIRNPNDPGYNADAIGLFYVDLDLSPDAKPTALRQDIIWSRIEAFTSYRWHRRSVEWLIEGVGDWEPPLSPATITASDFWDPSSSTWSSVVLNSSPFGGVCIPDDRTFRITATVGTSALTDLPMDVREAYRRLANYMAAQGVYSELDFDEQDIVSAVGAERLSMEVSHGDHTAKFDVERSPRANARALEYSGAGDLLRKYRKGR